MKIVRTANDDRDYPSEDFLNLAPMSERKAQRIADVINEELSGDDPAFFPSFWKVVSDDYQLSEPFEP